MSGVSGSTALSVYLSVVKDEQVQVTKSVKSDTQLAASVASFRTSAAGLTSAASILKNYTALSVLTGAYNIGGQIGRTAVLKDLITQNADSADSLVRQTANTDYLHFARATSARSTQTISLGDSSTLSLATSGASASSLTMQNTAWSLDTAKQTKAAPGMQWSFVLNDGTAGSSIAAALTAAAAGTTSADGTAPTYTVSAAGTVSGSAGAPSITTTTDSAGNTVYGLALSTDTAGNAIKSVSIVSVKVAGGSAATDRTAQVGALAGALKAAGFNAQLGSNGDLAILDPPGAGTNTLALDYGNAIAVATKNTLAVDGRLTLGDAGKLLEAGQILTDGTTEIGTVKSVDSLGNVTLTAAPTTSINAGDTIEVALGVGLANVGSMQVTASLALSGSTTLALGNAGASLKPGQIITSAGVTIGTVGSVDSRGNVTLLAGLTQAIAGGASLVVLPSVSGAPTAALMDSANVDAIVNADETASYETKMGTQYPGMDDALYYTRTMGSITSITGLMSNPTLLKVVTTSLGMGDWFGGLDYDQQVSILTKQVDLKKMTSASGIQRTAEQYLISKQSSEVPQLTGLAALLAGQSQSDTSLLSLITGASSTDTTTGKADPILSLFA
ncbi:MAG: DUF1217 domain-containing protein [Janthinobacterium lividum]